MVLGGVEEIKSGFIDYDLNNSLMLHQDYVKRSICCVNGLAVFNAPKTQTATCVHSAQGVRVRARHLLQNSCGLARFLE